jgi:hypothetical protein
MGRKFNVRSSRDSKQNILQNCFYELLQILAVLTQAADAITNWFLKDARRPMNSYFRQQIVPISKCFHKLPGLTILCHAEPSISCP